jgi:hypothetical protein
MVFTLVRLAFFVSVRKRADSNIRKQKPTFKLIMIGALLHFFCPTRSVFERDARQMYGRFVRAVRQVCMAVCVIMHTNYCTIACTRRFFLICVIKQF